jgi:FHS family L-fucose permease-like MFS transporter
MSEQLALGGAGTTPPATASSTAPTTAGNNAAYLRVFVFALFFFFGGITSLNDVIIPRLKELFTLSYAEVMTVQSAFFGAYFIISLPAAAVVRRIGYMRSAVVGLLLMMIGCLLFIPASASEVFGMFLVALFIVAAGITVVQVVANPLISLLGPPATVHSRLTFAQAFNSLGTTIFPYVGSALILGSLATIDPKSLTAAALQSYRAQATHVIGATYLGLALTLLVLAILVWSYRKHLSEHRVPGSSWREALGLLRVPRFIFGAGCIFLYVGAEVAIGSLIVNYLMQTDVLGLGQQAAGEHVPLYWGGAMVGRFIGSYLLIGLCNSIMFPTIFSLASEGLGPRSASASGIIAVAIVGGAVIPPLTGHIADVFSLRTALIVPAICHVGILAYGIYARRPAVAAAQA